MQNLTSPEAIIMLPIAFMLDSMGFMIFLLGTWFGIDDYGALDIIGGIIIGGWMFMRHSLSEVQQNTEDQEENQEEEIEENEEKRYNKSNSSVNNKTKNSLPLTSSSRPAKSLPNPVKKEVEDLPKKALKRFGLNFLIELLPFIGGLYPGWTIITWKELKN